MGYGTVKFDDEAHGNVRFSIKRDGVMLTNAFPELEEEKLEQMSDDELRRLIRILCGQ